MGTGFRTHNIRSYNAAIVKVGKRTDEFSQRNEICSYLVRARWGLAGFIVDARLWNKQLLFIIKTYYIISIKHNIWRSNCKNAGLGR